MGHLQNDTPFLRNDLISQRFGTVEIYIWQLDKVVNYDQTNNYTFRFNPTKKLRVLGSTLSFMSCMVTFIVP